MAERSNDMLAKLASVIPQENASFLFAYGSGVFAQQNQPDTSKNMVDFIVAVDDAVAFHEKNLLVNRDHYSLVRICGARWLSRYQKDINARVFCNTLVKPPGYEQLIKYSVIETKDLITDLLDWETLYISGRLHKPVAVIRPPESKDLQNALSVNLQSAIHASLLLLPENFSKVQLYTTLAGLSYSGDFRTYVGEDKQKVSNIVLKNLDQFELLYIPILNNIEQIDVKSSSVSQDLSISAVHNHLALLPRAVLWPIQKHWNKDGRNRDLEEVVFYVAHSRDYQAVVERTLKRIVFASSARQSVKNIFTAGVQKTLSYSFRKLIKMVRSMR